MQARAWTRQGITRATVVMGLLVALASVVVPHAVSAQEHPPGHGDGILPPGNWSDEQRDYLLDLVDRTEADLPQFGDVAALPKGQTGWIEFDDPHLDGYWHFINWNLIDDDHILDPNYPEALVYEGTFYDEDTGANDLELKSAMYILPSEWSMETVPAEYKWLPGLHDHRDLCVDETTKKFAFFAPCSDGARTFDQLMIHTWLEDPGCGHRFGGIGNSGLHCEVHGHPGGPGGPTTTGHQHPTTTEPGHGHPTTTEPGHGHPTTTRPGQGHDHDPPAAKPIHKHPTLTG